MHARAMDEIAVGQDGLVTYRQMEEVLGRGRSKRWIADGRVFRVLKGVYRLAGVTGGHRLTMRAGLIAAPRGAVLSHVSAGAVHGLKVVEVDMPHVTVDYARSCSTRGVVVHKAFLPGNQWTIVDGLRTTTVARTFVDLASVMDKTELGKCLDDAIATGKLTAHEIEVALDECGSQGRKGAATLRRLVRERIPLAKGSQSILELRFLKAVRRARLPQPETQWPLRVNARSYRLDAVWPERWLAVELDGYGAHGTSRKRFDDDRRRNNDIQLAGLTLLHFTARMTDSEMIDAVRHYLS